ncbi:unnamed protein product [Clonostachys rosea]|uniref:1,3-beta-glucanosyltransferase n=1 Tax=Bionectria ochroleuca TaxID=29856 RepID=A0ABY6UKE1_BIOOC|nr:unnamed protein product [Clonostachys rosea]
MKTYATRTGLQLVAVCVVLLFTNLAASLSPISVNGAKLYDGDGKQFFVKGVIYAGNVEEDVLLNGKQCQIDAGLMKSLGVNTIRVFGADSTKDHKECMEAFESQDIYVWMDLSTFTKRIDATKSGWTADLYNNFTSTVDHFAGYDNILAFTLGAEVLDNTNKGSLGAVAVKAAARDIRAFREARGYRQIPVTYSAASVGPHLSLSGQFLACGDAKNRIEMFGIDSFSLCSDSSSTSSNFDRIYETFEHYNIPVVFTETGCVGNESNPRDFKEIQTMMSPLYQNKFSGAIVYEWSQSQMGLVEYSDNARTGTPSLLSDYSALSTVFSTIKLPVTPVMSYTATEAAPECPTFNSASSWAIPGDVTPPTSISGIDVGTVTSRTTYIPSSSSKSASQTGTGTGTNAATGTGTGTGSGAISDGSDQGEQQTALSGGALIGVIVGCVLAALILLAIAVFFFMRRRNSRDIQEINQARRASPDASEGLQVDDTLYSTTVVSSKGEDFTEKIELPANSIGRRTPLQELDATPQSSNLSRTDAGTDHSSAVARSPPSAIKGFAPAAKASSIYEMPDTSLDILASDRHK